jgi:hypothetical protein
MEQVVSADGTGIAYEAPGQGPLAVVVGGAFNHRGTWVELTRTLAAVLPQGSAARLDGGFHEVPPAVLAPVPAAFYRAR